MAILFEQLKDKYKNVDMAPAELGVIMIGGFMFNMNGTISLSRSGYSVENEYVSIFTNVCKSRTPEQMDLFIQAIL